MKTLITGGAGFIGSHLADKLVSLGNEVIIIDNFSSGSMDNIRHLLKNPNVTVKKLDLKDHSKVLEEVRDIDIIFHFAANPEVRVSTTHPRIHFQENIVTTFNILEAMRINNIGKLVFASSSSVYGEPENIPVDESAPIKPVSVYGASKAACENLIYTYTRLYNINAVVLRYANVIGPRLR
ncbi:MAG TPA: SDR family NAD(P)-dependent oxidoreductase, partial [Thermoprotei archaeon]|nr:SDR family NAD(P)-dependent oxidoreductase [Thermoprotei archaeon]